MENWIELKDGTVLNPNTITKISNVGLGVYYFTSLDEDSIYEVFSTREEAVKRFKNLKKLLSVI